MNRDELVKELRTMYEAPRYSGRKVAAIHLFGIRYANQIRDCGCSPEEIAKMATGHKSYKAEISKGMVLSEYVEIRSGIKP